MVPVALSLYDVERDAEHGICLDCVPGFFSSTKDDLARLSLSDTGAACSLATASSPCCVFRGDDMAVCIGAIATKVGGTATAAMVLAAWTQCGATRLKQQVLAEERRRAFTEAAALARLSVPRQLLLLAAPKCPGCGAQSASTEQCEHATCPVCQTNYGTCCCRHVNSPDIGREISTCILNPCRAYMGVWDDDKLLLHLVSFAAEAARVLAERPGWSLTPLSGDDAAALLRAGLVLCESVLLPEAMLAHPARRRVLSGLKDLAAARATPQLSPRSLIFLDMTGEEMVHSDEANLAAKERHVDALLVAAAAGVAAGGNEWYGPYIADHCDAFRRWLEANPAHGEAYGDLNLRARLQRAF